MRSPFSYSLVFLFAASVSKGELLFYEPFDAPAGTELEDLGTPLGGSGTWMDESSLGTASQMTVRANGTEVNQHDLNPWFGIPDASPLVHQGGYLEGERRDDNSGYIALAPSVTATFTDGSVTWMSFVAASAGELDTNPGDFHHKPNMAIGEGELLDDRADNAVGQAIGGGAHKTNNRFSITSPTYWDDENGDLVFEEHRGFTLGNSFDRFEPQQLMVMKVEWGAETDTVSFFRFDISGDEGAVMPTEDLFDESALSITTLNNLDQSQFDTLSFHGTRCNFDEFRIGTTFSDVVVWDATPGGTLLAITEIVRSDVDGSVTITWNSFPGVEYAIDANEGLDADGWLELTDSVTGEADSATTSYTESVEDGNGLTLETKSRYYRVRVPD